jgi:sugar lactone lactonase YvrE
MRNNVEEDGSDLEAEGFTGSLYRVTPDGVVSVIDRGFGITNTLVWSPEQTTFYCGCSIRNVIYAYDYNAENSSVGNRRAFVENVAPGLPDGSAMDEEGCLWNCRFFGGCIVRISATGRVVQTIAMPVSNITNCCFGGSDLKTLFVTTASMRAGAGEKLAGGLFAIRSEVRGLKPGRFRLSASTISMLAV